VIVEVIRRFNRKNHNSFNFIAPMTFMLNNSRLNTLLVALLIIAAGIISLPVTLSTFAQTSSGGMKKTTNGSALDVLLQPSPHRLQIKAKHHLK
jgi:hypothetical protein